MTRHFTPCTVACDESWTSRAYRAGVLDGFHGYPKQDPTEVEAEEVEAYDRGFDYGKDKRP